MRVKATKEELREIFSWAKEEKDKRGKSLLERGRISLITGSYKQYNTEIFRDEYGMLDGTCSCPSWRKNGYCKHVIAHIIINNIEHLKQYKKWKEWIEKYNIEEKLKKEEEEKERKKTADILEELNYL